MEFSSKNTGMGCHFLLQGNLPDPRIEYASPVSPALQIDSLPTEPLGKLPPKRSFSVLPQRTENKILLQNRKVSILFICPENSATSSGTCFFVFLRKPKASSPMLAHGVLKWLVLPLIQKSSKTQN